MEYKGRVFIRTEVFRAGRYLDCRIYPVYQPAGIRREKCKPTSEIQQRINQRNAELELTRLAHANFTDRDIMLTLTYREQPENVDAAERQLRNYLRRVKRRRAKLGLEPLKYIYCTERGETSGRIHHHLMLNGGLERDELERLWGHGYANSRRIQYEGIHGITGLSVYMAKGSKTHAERETYRRYTSSRNLDRIEPEVFDGANTLADLHDLTDAIEWGDAADYFAGMFPGYVLAEATAARNSVNKGEYVHVRMWWMPPNRETRRAARKKRRRG